jgi:solute carrier family 45 protein 1/2/4
MTYCTPFLLNLGLTKSKVSLVWIAGPLSGLIMQPIVGTLSDKSRSSWGRRRPYMVGGAVIVCFCLLSLGWASEMVAMVMPASEASRSMTIFLAVMSIYGVDFAINAVQASARGLIVDVLPSSKQQAGSAWGTRMVAVGHLVGYGIGAIDLRTVFGPYLGDSQFKKLIVVSAVMLLICVGVTCWAVSERVLLSPGEDEVDELSLRAMFSDIIKTAGNLPPRISAICWTQFWCWIGWFPFLFYSTTWIGEVYLRFNADAEAKEHPDSLGQVGRVGSMSLIVFSLVTFVGSVVLPWLIEAPGDEEPEFTPRPPEGFAFLLEAQKHRPSLLTAWKYSHLIFAGSMICTPFITSLRAATILIALCGM